MQSIQRYSFPQNRINGLESSQRLPASEGVRKIMMCNFQILLTCHRLYYAMRQIFRK